MSRSIYLKDFRSVRTQDVPHIDDYKQKINKSWYCLVRILWDVGEIALIVTYEGKAQDIYVGRRPQDIYTQVILEHEENISLFHAAYLGKELKKAEVALALGNKGYFQE